MVTGSGLFTFTFGTICKSFKYTSMHVLICPDKFKGSLTAIEAAQAIALGLPANCTYTLHPLADGGDGSLEVVAKHTQGHWVFCSVHDPLFRPIQARYWISEGTAYLEMAQASGLALLEEDERNPCKSTSYGTGELMYHALTSGCRKFVLFIGGSATVDGGIGMLAALGFRFFDAQDNILSPVAENLAKIVRWFDPTLHFDLSIVCDVTNPLHGNAGAASMFGPQKGATPSQVESLGHGLRQFETRVSAQKRISWANFSGAGAAGGVGWAALAFLNARHIEGISFIAQLSKLEDHVKKADLILTGEGKIDAQTWHGKVPNGVLDLAKKHGIPVWAFCGVQEGECPIPVYDLLSVAPSPASAMKAASGWLQVLVNRVLGEYKI